MGNRPLARAGGRDPHVLGEVVHAALKGGHESFPLPGRVPSERLVPLQKLAVGVGARLVGEEIGEVQRAGVDVLYVEQTRCWFPEFTCVAREDPGRCILCESH